MTLKQAIKHAREKAKELKGTQCGDACAKEHEQLAKWLVELAARRKDAMQIPWNY